jgi:hypothetical protein
LRGHQSYTSDFVSHQREGLGGRVAADRIP